MKKVMTQQDTGWGIIFRLNGLFAEVEELAPAGKYDEWNIKLDRIWSNLVYRNNLDWFKDDKTDKIVDVKLCDDDFEKKNFLDLKILRAKTKINSSKRDSINDEYLTKKEYIIAKRELYQAILLKEIWLRKYMHELGLYLKEISSNPSGSMWGK